MPFKTPQPRRRINSKVATRTEHTAGDTGRAFRLIAYSIPILVGIVTFAAFIPVLNNGFINMDDPVSLLGNPYYRGLGWAQLRWMFTTLHNTLYRPLTWMTFAVDYLIWGMKPVGYHLASLLIHCGSAVLFYFAVVRLLSLNAATKTLSETILVRISAAFAALMFSVHPLRVEAVAWASARNDVLSAFFL
jgi:protein O-mannosyl-transferase